MLGPETARELSLGVESGELSEPPPQLEAYEIVYDSPATQYQKQAKLVGVTRTVEVAAPFIQADPGLLYKFNAEKIIDDSADALGVPLDLMRSDAEYREARKGYDAAQQTQAMIAAGGGIASAAKDAAAAQPAESMGGAA